MDYDQKFKEEYDRLMSPFRNLIGDDEASCNAALKAIGKRAPSKKRVAESVVEGGFSEDPFLDAYIQASYDIAQEWAEPQARKAADAWLENNTSGSDDEPTVPLLLKYPTWDMDGERHEAGETVSFPVDVAKTLISAGKAERNDPFPGD